MASGPPFYGIPIRPNTQPVQVEMELVRRAGFYVNKKGDKFGLGLFAHFKNLITFLWPEDYHHRWSDLIIQTWLDNRITVILGCRDSGKTRTISKCILADYYCFPNETLTLMTSTTLNGLERRVWGDIKSLHDRAKKLYPWLPGNVVHAKHGIFTDSVSKDGEIRDERKGISAVPCIGNNGEYLGDALREFAGIKQKRRRLAADEIQFVPTEYLKALDSLDKGDFKAAFLGNPIAGNGKALDQVAEPQGGWESIGTPSKTTTWKNKYQGTTINLVGTDSPNFDESTKNQFPEMLNQKDIDSVSARPGGRDSIEWWSQIVGVRKVGAVLNRVLTVEQVAQSGGFDETLWKGEILTKLYAIDAGFGGDPCIRTYAEFGKDTQDRDIMLFGEQVVIPILVSAGEPEGQIARYAKTDCDALGVPYSHVFFDAGMYATLAVQMARTLSTEVNAVNCQGQATDRPVSADTFIYDEQRQAKRLKTCYEHYSKLITEFWFSVRLLVIGGQARHFPRIAAEEFSKREWRWVSGNRYELESKLEYKVRNQGESPNRADSVAILVEGARRLGFTIRNMQSAQQEHEEDDWLSKERDKYRRFVTRTELKYS